MHILRILLDSVADQERTVYYLCNVPWFDPSQKDLRLLGFAVLRLTLGSRLHTACMHRDWRMLLREAGLLSVPLQAHPLW